MELLTLARLQFGMTTVFHYFFVPMTIGMAFSVAVLETMYVIKKEQIYKDMAKFWGNIFLLGFAVGVVTGIIQEFQFGMNWSEYSRFMGDIFGAPLAVEALLAFFLESTFIGLWIFGWDKFSPKVHALFIWLVSIGTMLSALWILAANSFMQNPVAYQINEVTNRAELTSFVGLLKNHQLWLTFPHVLFGAIVTGGFVIAGCSAWKLLRKEDMAFFKKSIKFGLIIGLIGSVGSIVAGHQQMIAVAHDQPMKFAAMEGIYDDTTGNSAPWNIVAGIDTKNQKTDWEIAIPTMLTILGGEKSYQGMDSVNADLHKEHDEQFGDDMNYYLPVKTLFWSFRFMAGFGSLLALLAIVGLFLLRKDKLYEMKWLMTILAVSTFFPFISNSTGWIITEMGRAPWTVYGLWTIADSVSPGVSKGSLIFSNLIYFFLFLLLGFVMIVYAKRTLKKGPYYVSPSEARKESLDPFSKEVF